MPISVTALTNGSINPFSPTKSFTTDSVTLTNGALIVFSIYSGTTSGNPPLSVVFNKNGQAFSLLNGTNVTLGTAAIVGIWVYRLMGYNLGTGTITAYWDTTFVGHIPPNQVSWTLYQFTGVDTSGINGSGAVKQSKAGATTPRTANASLQLTLTNAITSGNGTVGAYKWVPDGGGPI